MSLITLSVYEDTRNADMGMSVNIEFNSTSPMTSGTFPSRISAQAGDLAECDAASTCASDSDRQELFDYDSDECVSFQSGNRVSIRNLDPSISLEYLERALSSLGMKGVSIACPTFSVVSGEGSDETITHEFNFGYATIALSTTEQAMALNYLIESHGGELDLLFRNIHYSSLDYDDDYDDESTQDNTSEFGDLPLTTTTYDAYSVGVEMVRNHQPIPTTAVEEDLTFRYLSLYGQIPSILHCDTLESKGVMTVSFLSEIRLETCYYFTHPRV